MGDNHCHPLSTVANVFAYHLPHIYRALFPILFLFSLLHTHTFHTTSSHIPSKTTRSSDSCSHGESSTSQRLAGWLSIHRNAELQCEQQHKHGRRLQRQSYRRNGEWVHVTMPFQKPQQKGWVPMSFLVIGDTRLYGDVKIEIRLPNLRSHQLTAAMNQQGRLRRVITAFFSEYS